jgi:hypothetical protein
MCKMRLLRALIGSRPFRIVHNACRMGHSSGNGLEPGHEPRLARVAARMILAVKVREHDFMGEA